MLGAGEMKDPDIVGNIEIVLAGFGRIERHPPLPIFDVAVRVDDLGAGVALAATVEEPAIDAGYRIEAIAIADWSVGVGGAQLLLMLQSRPMAGSGEARVDLDADGADMRGSRRQRHGVRFRPR